jgi:hypothetical protein
MVKAIASYGLVLSTKMATVFYVSVPAALALIVHIVQRTTYGLVIFPLTLQLIMTVTYEIV